jgi:microcystin degradation protein MlrC
MRVGIIALQHESNTFAARPTTVADFQRDHVATGEAVRTFMRDAHHEVGGFLQGLEEESLEAVPLFSARALPGGPVEAQAFARLLETMFSALRSAGRLDGLLVAPHGAMVSEDQPDADGYWLALLRAEVGPELPIVCTLDPHANLTHAMIQACHATIAYRTNPHVDQRDRGREAARLMGAHLRGEVKLQQDASFPPLAINIERQRTGESHCHALYERADAIAGRPGILSVSIVLGFPYADVAEMGSSVIAVADARVADAHAAAGDLGKELWDRRRQFLGVLIDIETALDKIQQDAGEPRGYNSQDRPVLLLDMGDNVGGGGPGDSTVIAHALHRRRIGKGLVTLRDPESVSMCERAGRSEKLTLRMGGKSNTRHGPPLEANVVVHALIDGQFHERQIRHGGWADFDMGRTAIVQTDRGLTLMLTSERLFPVSAAQWTEFGIDPAKYEVIVAKGVHAPVAAYESICTRIMRVNTPGITTADMESLPYQHRRRPLFPFERDCEWTSV